MSTTNASKRRARRSYDDGCGTAHALDLVGERWALLVVRELGPERFTDLKAGLRGVSTNVPAERLRELEGAGIVPRVKLPPPAASRVYELPATDKVLAHDDGSVGERQAQTGGLKSALWTSADGLGRTGRSVVKMPCHAAFLNLHPPVHPLADALLPDRTVCSWREPTEDRSKNRGG